MTTKGVSYPLSTQLRAQEAEGTTFDGVCDRCLTRILYVEGGDREETTLWPPCQIPKCT